MKKIIFTVSALLIGSVAFGQSKKDVQLQEKNVDQPKKNEVRVIKPKTSVKPATPTKKTAARKEEVATPAREEKKSK